MDTTQLVNRAINGDENAINELYYNSYRPAYAVVFQMAKNEADAYDVLQQAYLKAFSSLHLLQDKSGFNPWFNKIVSNKCKDYLRAKHNVALFSDMSYGNGGGEPDIDIVDDSNAFQPEENVDYNETGRLVAEMLNNLPDDQKMVLLMYYVQDMSVKDIAEALEVSENTVKSRMRYGKMKMRAQAEELERKGTKLRVSVFALLPFLGWAFKSLFKQMPVHQMAPNVRTAALTMRPTVSANDFAAQQNAQQQNAQQSYAQQQQAPQQPVQPGGNMGNASAAAVRGAAKATKHTGRTIAIISIIVVVLAAGAFAFFAWGMPLITGKSNFLSQAVGNETTNSPQDLISDFVKALNDKDSQAMGKLFVPDKQSQRQAEGYGVSKLMDLLDNPLVQTEITGDLSNVTYNGETAEGDVTLKMNFKGALAEKLSSAVSEGAKLDVKASFKKVDGKWYINEFTNK